MFQSLRSRYAVIRVVGQHLIYQIFNFLASICQKFVDSGANCRRKIKLHMCSVLLELLQQTIFWSAYNVVNLVYLVKFIISWK